LSFINPLFLFAIAGAAIPVLIHLTRDIRVKKVQFSSLMFLRNTPKELIRRRRLRDLLLLLIRALIFALLAMAFARPFFPRKKMRMNLSEEDKSMVLLIDNSYSMQVGDLFEQARKEAHKIINGANNQDEIALVFFSDEAHQSTVLSSGKDIHRSALNNRLEITCRPTEYYKPLQLAEEILKEARNPSRQIILISDFQNIGFSSQFEHWNLDPDIHFIPVKVTAAQVINSYVNQFALKQSRVGRRNAVEYRIEILANDRVDEEDRTIDLWVDEKHIAEKKLTMEQMNQAFFQQLDLKEGIHQGFIRFSNDHLNVDNIHYFTNTVEDLPAMLCIDDARRNPKSDAFFLRSVFQIGDGSLYRFTAGGEDHISEERLKDNDLVFLANSGSLSNRQIDALLSYVFRGGSLILSFGERMNLDQFSEILERLGIGRITNRDMIRDPSLENGVIGQVNFKHPIFSVFIHSGASELYRPGFRRFVKIAPDSNAVILSRYDSGDPCLIESGYGKGKILVFTTTLNTKWTDLPVHEVYVPFLYQLAKYAVSRGKNRTSYLVGETVPFMGDPGDLWHVRSPENEVFEITVDETRIGRFHQTDKPGNYIATFGNRQVHFSVNVDVRESNLHTRDIEEAIAVFTKPSTERQLDFAGSLISDIQGDEKRQKLWLYIVLLVVFLFGFETYHANNRLRIKDES